MFRKVSHTSDFGGMLAGETGKYVFRHLQPDNLGPLQKQLRKQLADLKQVNAKAQVVGPCVHRPGGPYLSSVLKGTDGGIDLTKSVPASSEKPKAA